MSENLNSSGRSLSFYFSWLDTKCIITLLISLDSAEVPRVNWTAEIPLLALQMFPSVFKWGTAHKEESTACTAKSQIPWTPEEKAVDLIDFHLLWLFGQSIWGNHRSKDAKAEAPLPIWIHDTHKTCERNIKYLNIHTLPCPPILGQTTHFCCMDIYGLLHWSCVEAEHLTIGIRPDRFSPSRTASNWDMAFVSHLQLIGSGHCSLPQNATSLQEKPQQVMELIPASDHQCSNSFLLKRADFFFFFSRTGMFSLLHMTSAWFCQARVDTLWENRKMCLHEQDTGTWDTRLSCEIFMCFRVEVNGSTYVREYVTAATTTPHCVYPVLHIWNNILEWWKVKAQLWVLSFVSSILISYYEQSSPSTVLKNLKPNPV